MELSPPIPTATVPAVADPRPQEVATFGAVHLEVTDVARSTSFWHQVTGLHIRTEESDRVELGTAGETLVVLHGGASHGFLLRHSGLYHLAIHPPSEVEFARILQRLIAARWKFSPVDHVMSKAMYLNDPDGITVEITLETPQRLRELIVVDNVVRAINVDGELESGYEPFDLTAMLATLEDQPRQELVGAGTRIGHMHLYVADLLDAYQFYRSLGFTQALWTPHIGIGDLGAGGAFNHRIAVNTFQGVGAPQSPAGTARMRNFTIRLDTPDRLDQVLGALPHDVTETENGFLLADPAGNRLVLGALEGAIAA